MDLAVDADSVVKVFGNIRALDGLSARIPTGQIFGLGDFLVALITFIIVAFVIFLVVKIAKRWGME